MVKLNESSIFDIFRKHKIIKLMLNLSKNQWATCKHCLPSWNIKIKTEKLLKLVKSYSFDNQIVSTANLVIKTK